MEIKMRLDEFTAMLDKLRVGYIIDRVNESIVHIKVIRDNDMFRLRFIDNSFFGDGICFEFTNFFDD